MYTVYGIPNCSSVKKATTWLKENNIPFQFHDFKKEGISPEKLGKWIQQAGKEKLVNTKGTTWRGLGDSEKAGAATDPGAIALMANKPSLIKRPVIELGETVIAVGFDEQHYAQTLGEK